MLKERIRELRAKTNFSQSELGKMLNLTQQAIAKWEKGVSEPDSDNINALSRIFNVDVNYLLGNTDDPSPPDEDIDDEVWKIRERLRTRPETKILFDATDKVSKDDILKAVRIIEALKGDDIVD